MHRTFNAAVSVILFTFLSVGTAYAQTVPTSVFCPELVSTIQSGARDTTTGGQVSRLQRFLGEYNDLDVADIMSGYFGLTTRQYVRQFQCAAGIACYGDETTTGWGRVGTMTRAAIAARCGVQQVIVTPTPTVVQQPAVSYMGCQWYGSTIPHGGTVTGYRSPLATAASQCVSESRKCTDGTLSGSFNYGTCTGSAGGTASCAWNGRVIPSGDGVVAYTKDLANSGTQCVSQIRTCTNGTLSGTFTFSDCSVQRAGVAVTTTTTCTPVPGQTGALGWPMPIDYLHACSGVEGCAKGTDLIAQTCTTATTQTGSNSSCVFNGVGYAEGQYSTMQCDAERACWNSGSVYVCRGGAMRWETCGWGNAVGPRDPLSCAGGSAVKR